MAFCPKCGTKLEENGKFCVECGNSLQGNETSKPATVEKNAKGVSIASMILGIVSILWTLSMLISLSSSIPALDELLLDYGMDAERIGAIIGFCIGYTLFAFVPGIVSLVLGLVGCSRKKNGMAISGIIMGSIGIFASLVCIIYIATGI